MHVLNRIHCILTGSLIFRVNSLKSTLELLLPRLEAASSAASEAQEMVAMENSLEELEKWLVSSGKFSSNQHILRQIQEHRVSVMSKSTRTVWHP